MTSGVKSSVAPTLPFTLWSLAMEKRSQQKIVHIDRKATVR